VPKPTTRQLEWAELEIAALVHFSISTATPGNCSAPTNFSPDKLNTDQWVESFAAFGAREAVLVAKHACGFCSWPSNATMPDGSRFPYSTAYSSWRGGKGDVVESFLQSVTKAGLGVGYYYDLSPFTGLHLNLTDSQVSAIQQQQMTELWTKYGNAGNLSEVWFDGGVKGPMIPIVKSLLAAHQPNAMAFNGAGVTPNTIRYPGTEAGAVGNPNWSTDTFNGTTIFNPSESDTTLQLTDSWFYDPQDGIRSMAELQDVYHQTVGRNSLLMMDFSPTPEGIIPPDHAKRYAEFGAWQRGCYDKGSAGMVGIAEHVRGSEHAGPTQTLTFGGPVTIDRIVVREDQTEGQTINTWVVEAQMLSSHGNWTQIANGTSMGNKWITLLDKNLTVSAIRTVATGTFEGAKARIRSTSAHRCSRSIPSGKCNLRQDWAADGVGNSTNRNGDAKTIAECCEACSKMTGCALFVATPNAIDGHGCILWSATGVGGKTVKGAVTGSPDNYVSSIKL